MAQAPAAAATEEVAEAAPKPKSKLLMIIIAVLVMAIGGGAAYYFLAPKASHEGEQKKEKEAEAKPEIYMPMEVFTVNLRPDADSQQQQFLQVVMSLQMPTDKDVEKIKERMPEVRNRILYILSNKKASEISTVEGKDILVKEITNQINIPFYGSDKPQAVTTLFFTSFIIQ